MTRTNNVKLQKTELSLEKFFIVITIKQGNLIRFMFSVDNSSLN